MGQRAALLAWHAQNGSCFLIVLFIAVFVLSLIAGVDSMTKRLAAESVDADQIHSYPDHFYDDVSNAVMDYIADMVDSMEKALVENFPGEKQKINKACQQFWPVVESRITLSVRNCSFFLVGRLC